MLRYSTLLAAMIGCFALQYASADARGAYGANRAGCEITKPRLTTAPGTPGPNYWIAQDGLFAAAGQKAIYAGLPPRERHEPPGTYPMHLRRDGSIAGKVPWFRESSAYGKLRVRGTRRWGGDRMRGRYDNHLGPASEVIPGALVFPRRGCWHLTARSGEATLEATVWVMKVR